MIEIMKDKQRKWDKRGKKSDESHCLQYFAGHVPVACHLSSHPLELHDQDVCQVL